MSDSYTSFLDHFSLSKEKFFEFGINKTIYPSYEKAESEWQSLKKRIESNQKVYVRGFGRDAKGTLLFTKLYKDLLANEQIIKDPTNNAIPTKLIRELTGFSKTKCKNYEQISNYQVSHIFGRTKNVYAFTAPWNIVYIPKIIDPFTGHEAKGDMVKEFTALFQRKAYEKFHKLIDEFNQIMTADSFLQKVEQSVKALEECGEFDKKVILKFRTSLSFEFSPILINK